MFGIYGAEDDEGNQLEPDDEQLHQVMSSVGCGPCTWCGGAGTPMMEWVSEVRHGVRAFASSSQMFSIFDQLRSELESGAIDVDEVVEKLRADGSPLLRRVSDWLERRPATAAAVVGVLAILATMFGPYLQNDDDRAPGPAITEQQLEEILERVLTHYDEVNPPGSPDPPPARPTPRQPKPQQPNH